MKEVMRKILKPLINKLSRTSAKVRSFSERSYLCHSILTLTKVEIFHDLHKKAALLTMRRSEWGARNCHQIILRKVWTILCRKSYHN